MGKSIFDLTDEELAAMDPSELEESSTEEEQPEEEQVPQEPVEEQPVEETVEQQPEVTEEVETQPVEATTVTEEKPAVVTPAPVAPTNTKSEATEVTSSDEPSIDELKEFYRTMTSSFKAGGTDIRIRNAQEGIRLMQQGVGYTQKTQEMAHQRKVYMMLEKHGLTDPSQLSYLIDLHNKNPEAIKKLVIDAKLDPMEIDTTVAPAYQASNHQISDQDFHLREELTNLVSTEGGMETIKILDGWDQESQNALRRNPADMRVIHEHVHNGMYNQISGEITRYKSLGVLPITMPFYEAYAIVGQEMQRLQAEQAAMASPQQTIPNAIPQQQAQGIPPAQPVAVRTAPVANNVNNAALAAAAPRQAPPTAKKTITPDDIFNMSDAELAKLKL